MSEPEGRCVHGRFYIDPCVSCDRRYIDGKLVGPFITDPDDELRHCIECGAVCDSRVQACECDPTACRLPQVDR